MPRFGGILLEDYIERPDEKVGVFLRKRERRPQLDHIVMRSVGAGEDSALAQAVHHVGGLERRGLARGEPLARVDRKSTRLNSSHVSISYAVFCLKKKKKKKIMKKNKKKQHNTKLKLMRQKHNKRTLQCYLRQYCIYTLVRSLHSSYHYLVLTIYS